MLVYEAVEPEAVSYFVLIGFTGSRVAHIRDFLYASYALDGATITSESNSPPVTAD